MIECNSEWEWKLTGKEEAAAALGFLEDEGLRFEGEREVAIKAVQQLLDIHLRSVELRAMTHAIRARELREQNDREKAVCEHARLKSLDTLPAHYTCQDCGVTWTGERPAPERDP